MYIDVCFAEPANSGVGGSHFHRSMCNDPVYRGGRKGASRFAFSLLSRRFSKRREEDGESRRERKINPSVNETPSKRSTLKTRQNLSKTKIQWTRKFQVSCCKNKLSRYVKNIDRRKGGQNFYTSTEELKVSSIVDRKNKRRDEKIPWLKWLVLLNNSLFVAEIAS